MKRSRKGQLFLEWINVTPEYYIELYSVCKISRKMKSSLDQPFLSSTFIVSRNLFAWAEKIPQLRMPSPYPKSTTQNWALTHLSTHPVKSLEISLFSLQCQRSTLIIQEAMHARLFPIQSDLCFNPFQSQKYYLRLSLKVQVPPVFLSCQDENDPPHDSFKSFKLIIYFVMLEAKMFKCKVIETFRLFSVFCPRHWTLKITFVTLPFPSGKSVYCFRFKIV